MAKSTVFRILLFLIALSITIISLMPTSLSQVQENMGMQDKLSYSVNHGIRIGDALRTNEPVVNSSFVEIDREKTLELQVISLQKIVGDEQIVSAIIGIAGIVASLIAYRLGKKDLHRIAKKIIDQTIDVINADSRLKGESDKGKVVLNEEGKIIAKNERTLHESVGNITDHVGIRVRRFHEDSTGTEVLEDGRRGYYTDEE